MPNEDVSFSELGDYTAPRNTFFNFNHNNKEVASCDASVIYFVHPSKENSKIEVVYPWGEGWVYFNNKKRELIKYKPWVVTSFTHFIRCDPEVGTQGKYFVKKNIGFY